MKIKILRVASHGLVLLASLSAAVASRRSYFITFAGAPSTIACTNTDFTLGPGVSYSWNFPSAATQILIIGTAGATTIQNGTQTFGSASGTNPLSGGPPPYASTAFPYTVTYSLTPQLPGAMTSSFSFLCASATGTNFVIANGGAFGVVSVPTLDRWGLLTLFTLVAALSTVLMRRHGAARGAATG